MRAIALGHAIKKVIDQIKAAITSTKALNGQPTNVILASDSADEVVPLVDRRQLIYSQFVFSFFLSNPSLTCTCSTWFLIPRWPQNHWTWRRLGPHSVNGWVNRDCVHFISRRINIVCSCICSSLSSPSSLAWSLRSPPL